MVALTETQNEIARQQRALRSAGSKVVTAQDLYDSLRQGEDYHWLLIRHLLGLPYHALTDHEYLALAVLFASLEDEYIGRFLSYFVDEVDSLRFNELSSWDSPAMPMIMEALVRGYGFSTSEELFSDHGDKHQFTAWAFCPSKTSILYSAMNLVRDEHNGQRIQQRQIILSSFLSQTTPSNQPIPTTAHGDAHTQGLLISREGSRPIIHVSVGDRNVARIDVITVERFLSPLYVTPSVMRGGRESDTIRGGLPVSDIQDVRAWNGLNAQGWSVVPFSDEFLISGALTRHLARFHEEAFAFTPTPLTTIIASNIADELMGVAIGEVAGPAGGPAIMASINTIRDLVEQERARTEALRLQGTARTITDAMYTLNLGQFIPFEFGLELRDNGVAFTHAFAVQDITQAHINAINNHANLDDFRRLEGFDGRLTTDIIVSNPVFMYDWWDNLDEETQEKIQRAFNEIPQTRRGN